MEQHHQLSDYEFSTRFGDGSLEPSYFTHEAHLRLAWIYVQKLGVVEACERVCKEIARFDGLHGDGTKFHKTLTVAAVKAVWHFIQKSGSDNFRDFIREFPQLKFDFKSLIDSHYGFDLLASKEAKRRYISPDVLPFT